MTDMVVTMRRPSGFSDPAHFEEEVAVVGYLWGKNQDAGGYNRSAECALAVVVGKDGRFRDVPVSWLSRNQSGG